MKRRHSRDDAIELCARLAEARPGMVFGADLIAGFPTEDEAAFRRSLDLIGECGLTHLHVFPYSERPHTPAARIPGVPVAERKERAARLRAEGQAALERYLDSRVGHLEPVLVEDGVLGRTEGYARVRLERDHAPGGIVTARVTGSIGSHLIARVVDG
jgi:threonylcarbamoyladenosine tRNA methylthiotransferase MtaB